LVGGFNMKYAKDMFEDWVSSTYESPDSDMKEFLREAFDAGFAAAAIFLKEAAACAANEFLETYDGFESEH